MPSEQVKVNVAVLRDLMRECVLQAEDLREEIASATGTDYGVERAGGWASSFFIHATRERWYQLRNLAAEETLMAAYEKLAGLASVAITAEILTPEEHARVNDVLATGDLSRVDRATTWLTERLDEYEAHQNTDHYTGASV